MHELGPPETNYTGTVIMNLELTILCMANIGMVLFLGLYLVVYGAGLIVNLLGFVYPL